jgi:hypothetical protein
LRAGVRAIALGLVAVLLQAAAADAQQAKRGRTSGSDLRRLRMDALRELPSAAAEAGVPVALTLTNGFTYNSNPNQRRNASGADWHDNPDLQLDLQPPAGAQFQMTATFDINTDRYLRTTTADNDEAWGQIKLAYTDGLSGWVPYVANRLDDTLETNFARQALLYDDVSVGVARGFSFDADWRPTTPDLAANLIGLDLNAGRRQANVPATAAISAGSGTFLRFKLGYGYQLTDTVALGIATAAEATFRDDDGPGSPARRDVLLLGLLNVEWSPEWLSRGRFGTGQFDLSIQAATNRSTNRAARFDQADIGPYVTFFWTF